jgi:2-polyprenyl-6-methoxyphenol hydroxylase-like FAD-dependent oxidoreductase
VVIERNEREASTGAGLYLIGAAMRALGALGVGNDVERASAVSQTQKLFTHRGRLLAEVDAERFWAPCGPCLGIARASLHQILLEKAPSLTVQYGTSIVSVEQRPDAAAVELTDRLKGEYALVVGADGIRSHVSRLALGVSLPRYRGQVGWRFLGSRPPGIDGWTVYLASDRAFLMLPISASHVYCYADRSEPQPVPDPPDGRLKRLRNTFRDFAEPVGTLLAELNTPNEVHFSAIEDVVLDHWSRGRVVLIGDAAHAMSPNMACGAALAFEDALVLAELIDDTGLTPALLPRFEQRRADRVRWVRDQTDRRDRLRRLPAFARNALLRLAASRTYAANYGPLLAAP